MRRLKQVQFLKLHYIQYLLVSLLANIGYRLSVSYFAINLAISGFAATSFPTPAYAMPFTCSGDIYQVQSGQLRIFDPIISSYVDVGSPNGGYNAVGFNTQDNFAYGSQGSNIIRINAAGVITTIFSGNPNFNSFAGDVDSNNTLWLRNSASQYTSVNLATGSATTINLTGSVVNSADIIAVENAGTPYLLTIRGTQIGRINRNTGVSTSANLTGLNPSGSYGASWADSTGRIFTFHNTTGEIFEIFGAFGSSPTGVLVAQGDPSNSNDGFSCDQAPFPNLPPLAMDDTFSGPFNNNITGNILVDNGNGVDEDPEGFTLTINTTPITPPSNGTVTILANGDFTYIPNNNYIGTDTFEYQITDPSGLSATAIVTITLTGSLGYNVTKTQTGGPNPITVAGQIINYEIEVESLSTIPLTGINVVDTLPNGLAGTATLQSGDANNDGNLDTTETFIYTISYTVAQDDIDNGVDLVNQVSVTTNETGASPVNSSASTPISKNPSLTVTKVASPRLNVPAGTSILYTYTVTNNGNVTLSNVDLNDVHTGSGTPPIPGNETLSVDATPIGDSSDSSVDGVWDTLRPGDSILFTANYTVTQQDIDMQ